MLLDVLSVSMMASQNPPGLGTVTGSEENVAFVALIPNGFYSLECALVLSTAWRIQNQLDET